MGGAVAVVLYPIWPPVLRDYVPYLLYALLAVLLGIELGADSRTDAPITINAVRYLLYLVVFGATLGRVRFWIFPQCVCGAVARGVMVAGCTTRSWGSGTHSSRGTPSVRQTRPSPPPPPPAPARTRLRRA